MGLDLLQNFDALQVTLQERLRALFFEKHMHLVQGSNNTNVLVKEKLDQEVSLLLTQLARR